MSITDDDLQLRYGWHASSDDDYGVALHALRVPAALRQRLESFAIAMAPSECCGIGIGPHGQVAEFHPVRNIHETPVTRYQISADDQLRIYKRALERDWDITLVFHTHPATEAIPSATDAALAAWPDAVYVILSLAAESPHMRGYRIIAGQVTELSVN